MNAIAIFLAMHGLIQAAETAQLNDASRTEILSKVDFASRVLPLLSEHCFACHGPDTSARESGLRLDTFRGATARAYSGRRAIVPGDAAASELIARVSQHSGEQIMPPDGHNPLSVAQVQLLRAWIDDGAEYTSHWAFLPVRKVTPPTQPFFSSRNIIDLFVAQQLESRGLTANPPADARTLIRRVTLDLTGLPPSASELQALCDNWSEESYLDYVDRLLASPRYGEHMATSWLDAARYADTNGYQHDNGRKMWAWRDWVVNAMNRNMPFDQFVVEQLAGDLLPEPTEEQVIATGFNRNHGLNFEGGSIAAESLTEYVVDRTNVFGTTFLGLTVGCSQCHDHKYDPLTQVDYYGLLAYFNNNDDEGFAGTEGNAKPTVDVQWPAHDQLIAQLEEQLKQLASQTSELVNSHRRELNAWENRVLAGDEPIEPPGDMLVYLPLDGTESSIVSAGPEGIKAAAQNWRIDGSLTKCEGKVGSALHFDGSTLIDCGDIGQFDSEDAFSYGAWVYADGAQGTPILGRAKFHGYDLQFDNGHFLAEFVNRWDINAIFVRTEEQFAAEQWHHVVVTYDGTSKAAGVRVFVDGVERKTETLKDDLTGSIASESPLVIGGRNEQSPGRFRGRIDDVRLYPRALAPVEIAQLANVAQLRDYLDISLESRSETQQQQLHEYFLQRHVPEFQHLFDQQAAVKRQLYSARDQRMTTMVMRERVDPRRTYRLTSGRYDLPAEEVLAHVPLFLPPLPAGAPANRLGLAQWLVSDNHPLTSRVAVNRYWQHFFGRGIVTTADDFGLQGAQPSHPQLLDWLAGEFMDSGWNVKSLHRLIVTSATYRQSSSVSREMLEQDPENMWLARFNRRRMPAETLRDAALACAGLLNLQPGGPGVMPFQPAGLWEELSFLSGHTSQKYVVSEGGDALRRSLYTFRKRSCPPPNMQIFDASERAVCLVQRTTTNTPLQTLVLLNDPVFVQPAVALALNASMESDVLASINQMFERVLGRRPSPVEQEALEELFRQTRESFEHANAAVFLNVLETQFDRSAAAMSIESIAALATVGQVILAMDEAITIN